MKKIKSVHFDSQKIGITDFNNNYIVDSNLVYFRSYHFSNISSYMAEKYGQLLLRIVSIFLLILLISQLFLFFFTIIESIIKKESLIVNDHPILMIKAIDYVSKNYAIILGFLGTVLSIWITLELSMHDYSNFFQILDIIRLAIFTTVEGLLIVTIYSIREFVNKWESWNAKK